MENIINLLLELTQNRQLKWRGFTNQSNDISFSANLVDGSKLKIASHYNYKNQSNRKLQLF